MGKEKDQLGTDREGQARCPRSQKGGRGIAAGGRLGGVRVGNKKVGVFIDTTKSL